MSQIYCIERKKCIKKSLLSSPFYIKNKKNCVKSKVPRVNIQIYIHIIHDMTCFCLNCVLQLKRQRQMDLTLILFNLDNFFFFVYILFVTCGLPLIIFCIYRNKMVNRLDDKQWRMSVWWLCHNNIQQESDTFKKRKHFGHTIHKLKHTHVIKLC